MLWNWQLSDWPRFKFDPALIAEREKQFLIRVGEATASLHSVGEGDYKQFIVEILSREALESSNIEGEILDRESLQSSIKKHFGIKAPAVRSHKKEAGMAELLCNVYETFQEPLSHAMLCRWHSMLFDKESGLDDAGRYRTHAEPMQIVSRRYDRAVVYFEAPPSEKVHREMGEFIKWYNSGDPSMSILAKAAIAHLYFENIHPFEDGNGRIGRALVEKFLSSGVNRPVLIAVSNVLEKERKGYYAALEQCNRSLDADGWVDFFTKAILKAQEESIILLHFLIGKTKLFSRISGLINPRQEKALLKIYESGPDGFKGGLSAENYIAMTKASRATATRDLAELVQLGALTKTGELRHTRYWLIA